jgi:hypothetical protein
VWKEPFILWTKKKRKQQQKSDERAARDLLDKDWKEAYFIACEQNVWQIHVLQQQGNRNAGARCETSGRQAIQSP